MNRAGRCCVCELREASVIRRQVSAPSRSPSAEPPLSRRSDQPTSFISASVTSLPSITELPECRYCRSGPKSATCSIDINHQRSAPLPLIRRPQFHKLTARGSHVAGTSLLHVAPCRYARHGETFMVTTHAQLPCKPRLGSIPTLAAGYPWRQMNSSGPAGGRSRFLELPGAQLNLGGRNDVPNLLHRHLFVTDP